MAASSPKTQPTQASVAAFIAAIPEPERRADCETLARLMQAVVGEPPVMWGSAIVGFGAYRYQYASGTQGDWPLVAFSPRKGDLSVYLMPGFEVLAPQLQKLGRHKTGKACLYLRKLADVDPAVLRKMIEISVASLAPQRVKPASKP
jgi:hypothetical protein